MSAALGVKAAGDEQLTDIDRDAARVAREATSTFPDRTVILTVFDDWDTRDKRNADEGTPHIDALCGALSSMTLSPTTTALDMVWHAIHATPTSGQLFDSLVAGSATYRDYQPGPPLRSFWQWEAKAADELRLLVQARRYDEVASRLAAMWDRTNVDDIVLELVKYLSSTELVAMAQSERGRILNARLYDELTSGSVAADEEAQAKRLLQARMTDPASTQAFEKAATSPALKVFPFKKGGITTRSALPSARITKEGKIHVRMSMNVRTDPQFEQDWQTLPLDLFTDKGIVLDPDEFVGVRMYDEGGQGVVTVPALRLIALSNEGTTHTMGKIAEVAGFGLGGFGGGAAKAVTLGAKVLMWLDRAAVAFGVLSSAISENRGWFIRKFGDDGRKFVAAVEIVNSAIAIFGMFRVAVELPKLVGGLWSGLKSVRSRAAQLRELSAEERRAFTATTDSAEKLHVGLENVGRENRASAPLLEGATPAPVDNVTSISAAKQRRYSPEVQAVLDRTAPGGKRIDPHEPSTPNVAATPEIDVEEVRVAAGAEGHEPIPARTADPNELRASAGKGKKAAPSSSGSSSKAKLPGKTSSGGAGSPQTPTSVRSDAAKTVEEFRKRGGKVQELAPPVRCPKKQRQRLRP